MCVYSAADAAGLHVRHPSTYATTPLQHVLMLVCNSHSGTTTRSPCFTTSRSPQSSAASSRFGRERPARFRQAVEPVLIKEAAARSKPGCPQFGLVHAATPPGLKRQSGRSASPKAPAGTEGMEGQSQGPVLKVCDYVPCERVAQIV